MCTSAAFDDYLLVMSL